jgi:hypothetical protein
LSRLLTLLRSPRLALAVIGFIAIWTGVGAWAPWMQPNGPAAPPWAATVGLDHPFTSWPFLLAVALLFVCTLACTWGRRARIRAIRRGEFPPSALRLAPRDADVRAFLATQGFRGQGDLLTRFGVALWGGWLLHVGLLLLIAAVLVQHALFDSGVFDLSEGERARLSAHGTVFGREKGPFAREDLPDIDVALQHFDPFLQQRGYSRDRLSLLEVAVPGEPPRVETVDRAAGIRAGDIEIFQAIPSGLAITLDVPGMGMRTLRLQEEAPRRAFAEVTDPVGMPARFVLDSERELGSPDGTGRVLIWVETRGRRMAAAPGGTFPFGAGEARVVGIGRWGRFTFTRTPGLAGVFAGFGVILAGCALLVFPAGVARMGRAGDGDAAVLFTVRGGAAIAAEWERAGPPA